MVWKVKLKEKKVKSFHFKALTTGLLLEKCGESSDTAFVTAHISHVNKYILAMCKQHESKQNRPTSAVGLSSRGGS